MVVVGEAPASWRGVAAEAYGRWARYEARAARELDDALRRASAEIAVGGEVAARLAAIDLPAAVPVGGPSGPVAVPVGAPSGTVPQRPAPAVQRDRDNRARLAADLRDLRGRPRPTRAERARLAVLETVRARLDELGRTVDPVTGAAVPVQLFEYEPGAFSGDGIVTVAIGDLDSADGIGVLVPGMGTTAASIGAVGANAAALYTAARRADSTRTAATLAWIGYDAPSGRAALAQVLTQNHARRGAAQLHGDLADIAAMRAGEDPRVVVYGHSYGSTTAAIAGAGGALSGTVDAMVLLGSPGAGPVRAASELGMPVYVARDSDDPVPWAGATSSAAEVLGRAFGLDAGLGTDPAAPSFGAVRIDAEAPSGLGLGAHSGYFRPGSQALDEFARILVGGGGHGR